jgi:hypothetical protein
LRKKNLRKKEIIIILHTSIEWGIKETRIQVHHSHHELTKDFDYPDESSALVHGPFWQREKAICIFRDFLKKAASLNLITADDSFACGPFFFFFFFCVCP